jgi:tripartite ATP-independent transporter DctP family solute receptor
MRTSFAALGAVIFGLAGTIGTAHAETVLRFAHTQPASDTHHLAAERFAKLVEERTKGEVKVEVHAAGELGNDSAILEGVRLGTIDIGQTGNPFYTRFAPRLNVLDLPYLFRDYEQAYKVLDGDIGRSLLGDLEERGMKGLAFWEIGFRKISNSKRPIRTPADLKGLKIRTTPNPAHVKAFEIFGAIPTPMPFTEVYMALETGTVDGQENPLNIIRSNKFQEVQKYLSFTDHAYTASVVSMNLRKFKNLTPEQQKIVLDAAQEAAIYQRQLNRDQAADDLKAIEQAGVQVIQDIDREAFKKLVFEPAKKGYTDQFGSELVDKITATQ